LVIPGLKLQLPRTVNNFGGRIPKTGATGSTVRTDVAELSRGSIVVRIGGSQSTGSGIGGGVENGWLLLWVV